MVWQPLVKYANFFVFIKYIKEMDIVIGHFVLEEKQ